MKKKKTSRISYSSFRIRNNFYSVFSVTRSSFLQVQDIFFSPKGYEGASNLHESDIAIVRLHEKISLSPAVLPACIHWNDNGVFQWRENTPGKVNKIHHCFQSLKVIVPVDHY